MAAHCSGLISDAIQQDAEEVAPGLAAAGVRQLPGNPLRAAKALKLLSIQLPTHTLRLHVTARHQAVSRS